MNYLKYTCLLAFAAVCMTACEYDTLKTFDKSPDVYFTNLRDAVPANDSIFLNFFFIEGNIQDTTYTIPVTVTGPLSSTDRYVSIIANEKSTAVEGVNYTMSPTVTIPAGKVTGVAKVKIFRSPDLRVQGASSKVLIISLQPSTDFGTDIKKDLRSGNRNDTISVLDFRMRFTDLMAKPKRWSMSFFGNYSDTKFNVICTVNAIAPAYLDGQEVNGKTMKSGEDYTFGKQTQIYLMEQAAAGNVILDEDGMPMKMGEGL